MFLLSLLIAQKPPPLLGSGATVAILGGPVGGGAVLALVESDGSVDSGAVKVIVESDGSVARGTVKVLGESVGSVAVLLSQYR